MCKYQRSDYASLVYTIIIIIILFWVQSEKIKEEGLSIIKCFPIFFSLTLKRIYMTDDEYTLHPLGFNTYHLSV